MATGKVATKVKVEETRETIVYPERKDKGREETIEAMLPLVNHIVLRMAMYLPPHLSHEDLVSAGVIGLIDAVDRYDPTKGTVLKTYCSLRIRGAILDELRRLDWVPRSVHREARRLQEAQEKVAQRLGREPMEEEVRQELGVSEEDFQKLLDRVKPASYFSLQEPVREGEDGDSLMHEEILADVRASDAAMNLLREEDLQILKEQLNKLPLPQMQILCLYYMEDLRLKEIAEIMDLTESRVSQIHTMAVNRLRSTFDKARKR
jgi:RNA polymerase sigma factor for flagellar operon FliA